MNCNDFIQILDAGLEGDPPPAEWSEHAATCPRCALVLRLERTLRSAPRWAENPRLSARSRAAIVSVAGATPMFWRHVAAMAEEAAVSALVGAGMVAMAIYAGPSLWNGAVPEPVRLAVSPYLQPLFSGLGTVGAAFEPLLHQGWGVALISLTGFVVLFAAALSTRALSLRPAR